MKWNEDWYSHSDLKTYWEDYNWLVGIDHAEHFKSY